MYPAVGEWELFSGGGGGGGRPWEGQAPRDVWGGGG